MDPSPILTPFDAPLDALCEALAAASSARDASQATGPLSDGYANFTEDRGTATDESRRAVGSRRSPVAAVGKVADAAAIRAADAADDADEADEADGEGRSANAFNIEDARRRQWPARQLGWCGEHGVFRWSASREAGGYGWSDADLLRGYLRLAEACLTTAFVITQRTAASARLADSANGELRSRLLPDLLAGRSFATVAISQLTTSRRHLASPALRARETAAGYALDGYSPWVTGAAFADWMAVGATLDDGRQLLLAVPARAAGVRIDPPSELLALEGSHTGPVRFEAVAVGRDWVIAGPGDQVLRTARSGGSGGLQTSALALALASRAIGFLEAESTRRIDLRPVAAMLRSEWHDVRQWLLAEAGDDRLEASSESGNVAVDQNDAVGGSLAESGRAVSRVSRRGAGAEALRAHANDLVLRACQTALIAAKGAGFVAGHPAGRWCREALFFLVWSCPPGVLAAHLEAWSNGSNGRSEAAERPVVERQP